MAVLRGYGRLWPRAFNRPADRTDSLRSVARDWKMAGQAVMEARKLRWRTRADFAVATGVPVRTLSDLERGRRDNFSVETLGPIEDALEWKRGSIVRAAEGGRPQPLPDPDLARVQAAWPALSRDARRILADLASNALKGR